MICKNCSHENDPSEKICTNCGVPLIEEEQIQEPEEVVETPVDAAEETVDVEAETNGVETAADETIAATDVADAYTEEQAAEETPQPKKRSGLIAFSGLIALVLIAVGLWVVFTGIFAPKYSMPVDRSKLPISYIKDYKLFQKPISGSATQVSESLVKDRRQAFPVLATQLYSRKTVKSYTF